ncbi:MAG: AAA family ATPase [Candidatus Omnitrophica bacterium]|nr:AAA family ATPase [Candidatus Omnitrophota bacterium]
MYLDYYGLKHSPFNITCNPDFFYGSASHQEALAALLYGVQEKKGIILITGEVGTGKTTLCRTLLNRLPPSIKTSFILNPYFSQTQLLQAIVEDFGIKPKRRTRLSLVNELNTFLLEVNKQGSTATLIIDEAQNLTARQLEQVRLLTNLETAREKLLQVILSGQPELTEKLKKTDLRQIRQRIFVKCNLSPLKEKEVQNYVEHRLNQAGTKAVEISSESYETIYEFSKGIPRLINMLCDRALLCGFAKEKKTFNRKLFQTCIEELK